MGGEALERKLAEEVEKRFGEGVEIYNEYGPTEATVGCMIHPYRGEDEREQVAIGRPIANTRIYIMDEEERAVGEGVVGEIYIGGEGVARGYLNREEMTKERFKRDPNREGERMYRTGDLGRRLSSGDIEYVGRRDEQIKWHGHRVEMGEIRAGLNRHPKVRDSAVVVKREESGREVMVAYYVSREEVEEEELKEVLRETVAEEVLPGMYVRISRMPLTLNGKVNYGALPGLEEARKGGRRKYEGGRTEEERKLVKIWEEVLGVKEVGIRDNFFRLGGDSIISIQIIARANQAGMGLTPKQLFENPTVEELAGVAGKKEGKKEEEGEIRGEMEADADPEMVLSSRQRMKRQTITTSR